MQLLIESAKLLVGEVLITECTECKGPGNGCVAIHQLTADRIEVVIPETGIFTECPFEFVNSLVERIDEGATLSVRREK